MLIIIDFEYAVDIVVSWFLGLYVSDCMYMIWNLYRSCISFNQIGRERKEADLTFDSVFLIIYIYNIVERERKLKVTKIVDFECECYWIWRANGVSCEDEDFS
ncbi:hypothetical protein J1N35_035675 [Gossypium stocksii]|uniref:Transmembrane protein n=1 Tax=Gossypium stocksii TaxID=47602 RepID=A0A9D3ZRW5_9ROSI|nr:hypothetical protein J1N35_035675 [Gossypium stocksii]